MTRVDLINEKINQLQAELDVAQKAYNNVRNQEKAEFNAVLEKYFGGYENENITMDFDYQGICVRYKEDRYSILTIHIKDSWRKTEGTEYVGIELAHSSNRSDVSSDWVEQLEAMAYFAKVAQDFKDDILAEVNDSHDKNRSKASEAYKVVFELERQIKELNSQAFNLKVENMLDVLQSEEGLVFEDKYPTMQVKFNDSVYGIAKMKVVKTSASGESVDIDFTTYSTYNNSFRTQNITRVKKDRLINFLNEVNFI